jgi:hypothetical protein
MTHLLIKCLLAHVFWNTVSPDGKYVLAWSATGETTNKAIESGDDTASNDALEGDDTLSNYVIEVASRRIVVRLPKGRFWRLYHTEKQPSHADLSTTWSDDSRLMLIIYDSRYVTDAVYLVNVSTQRATEIERQLKAFDRRSAYGPGYSFANPWFVSPGRFYLKGSAGVSKDTGTDSDLYFQTENGGSHVRLVKAQPSSDEGELVDRSLNRSYRTLHGLLTGDGQKALVVEERAWLTARDVIKSKEEQQAYIEAQIKELETRIENAVQEKEKE